MYSRESIASIAINTPITGQLQSLLYKVLRKTIILL